VEVISLNSQYNLFARKENAIHWRSKLEEPSTDFNPHWIGLLTDNPRRHRQQEEAVPHLHIENSKRAKIERLRSARLIQGER
jgi:hypothetical protein